MTLHVLPNRLAGAAENMAIDFLLLQRYPDAGTPRFRTYGWHRPAFTFGYSQKIALVRSQVPPTDVRIELCRRFTGGGLVDHREDWTYALALPRGHALEEARAIEAYRAVHDALAVGLRLSGQPAELQPACASDEEREVRETTGVCFTRAECFDVIHPETGAKIAGAAQKRSKHGLILQGSIWRPAAPGVRDWESFEHAFVEALGEALQATPDETPWPDFNEEEVTQLTERYASAEWTDQR
jgi:lipoate-protein ligase A